MHIVVALPAVGLVLPPDTAHRLQHRNSLCVGDAGDLAWIAIHRGRSGRPQDDCWQGKGSLVHSTDSSPWSAPPVEDAIEARRSTVKPGSARDVAGHVRQCTWIESSSHCTACGESQCSVMSVGGKR